MQGTIGSGFDGPAMPARSDALAGLSPGSGASGQVPVDPSAAAQLPATVLATGSFLLVLAFGTIALWRSREFVERGIVTSMRQPHMSLVYGLIAYGLVGFIGFLLLIQLSFAGISDSSFRYVALALIGAGMLSLAGPGYAIVGTRVLDQVGGRQPWNGLALGAVLSATSLLVLPLQLGALVWLLVAALGIGGPVREWMHADRDVNDDTAS